MKVKGQLAIQVPPQILYVRSPLASNTMISTATFLTIKLSMTLRDQVEEEKQFYLLIKVLNVSEVSKERDVWPFCACCNFLWGYDGGHKSLLSAHTKSVFWPRSRWQVLTDLTRVMLAISCLKFLGPSHKSLGNFAPWPLALC